MRRISSASSLLIGWLLLVSVLGHAQTERWSAERANA